MARRSYRVLLVAAGALLGSCGKPSETRRAPDAGPPGVGTPDAGAAAEETVVPPPPEAPRHRDELTLIAGGDVSFGRALGKALLDDPKHDFFRPLQSILRTADLRFVNLEGPLTDQHGEVESPDNMLIFCGPPAGADALGAGAIDIVSLANNHAWDYGKKALFETMDNLDRVGVRYVGAGRTRADAYAPVVLERDGFRLAMLAVTDIWNQGPLSKHPGADYVAGADAGRLSDAVRALRADASIDAIVVSYHGGCEYLDEPITRTKEILRAAIDAGADAVIAHHPHVVQGVEWRRGRPIFYSLGNLLMRMHSNHAWTGMSFLARIRLRRGEPPTAEACPFHILGIEALPLAGDPERPVYERQIFDHLTRISKAVGGTRVGPLGDDGCAALTEDTGSIPTRAASTNP